MPVRYQRFTYRYLQGRPRILDTAYEQTWLTSVQPASVTGARRPPVDVWETSSAMLVKVMLPGVSEEDIKALLYEDVILVSANRTDDAGLDERRFHRAEIHYGLLEAAIPLPAPVDPEGIEATYRQGVLLIRLNKRTGDPGSGARA